MGAREATEFLTSLAVRDKVAAVVLVSSAALSILEGVFTPMLVPVYRGAMDDGRPVSGTACAVAHCRALGIMAVEMEAAALYALAEAR
jgi:hypothetical protein